MHICYMLHLFSKHDVSYRYLIIRPCVVDFVMIMINDKTLNPTYPKSIHP